MKITFSVDGNPKPQQGDRSRIVTTKDGRQFIQHYQKKNPWKETIRLVAQENKPDHIIDGPIAMKVRIRRLRTSGYRKKDQYPWKRPDVDNHIKPVLDAMQGVIYRDDARICRLLVVKVFSDREGIDVEIEEMADD